MDGNRNKTDSQSTGAAMPVPADTSADSSLESFTCPGCQTEIRERVRFCPVCRHYLGELFFEQSLETPIQLLASIQDVVFCQGEAGILSIKVKNNTGERLTKIELNIESKAIDDSLLMPAVVHHVADGKTVAFRLNLIPKPCGLLLGKIYITYWITDDQPNVLEGEASIYVSGRSNIGQVNVDRSVHIEGESTGVDTGGDVIIKIDGIHNSINKILPENFKEGTWRELPLKWSLEATKILRENLSTQPGPEHPSETTEPAAPSIAGAWIRWELPDQTVKRLYLHLKPEVHLGRDKDQDMLCVCLDDNFDIDEKKTSCISREHLTLRIDSNTCIIEDHSTCGTIIDSHKLHHDAIAIHNGQIINLAGVYPLKYHEFKDLSSLHAQVKNALLASTTLRQSSFRFTDFKKNMDDLPLNAVRLRKINADDPADYFIILKELDIGRADKNPLTLPFKDVSDLHAKLVLYSGRLRLVDLGSSRGTWVNDQKLDPYAGKVLHNDDVIRLGPVSAVIKFVHEKNAKSS